MAIDGEDFVTYLEETLPKSAHKYIAGIVAWVDESEYAYAAGAEVVGAHVATDEHVIGDWTIRTDVVGNPVSIDFGQSSVQVTY